MRRRKEQGEAGNRGRENGCWQVAWPPGKQSPLKSQKAMLRNEAGPLGGESCCARCCPLLAQRMTHRGRQTGCFVKQQDGKSCPRAVPKPRAPTLRLGSGIALVLGLPISPWGLTWKEQAAVAAKCISPLDSSIPVLGRSTAPAWSIDADSPKATATEFCVAAGRSAAAAAWADGSAAAVARCSCMACCALAEAITCVGGTRHCNRVMVRPREARARTCARSWGFRALKCNSAVSRHAGIA